MTCLNKMETTAPMEEAVPSPSPSPSRSSLCQATVQGANGARYCDTPGLADGTMEDEEEEGEDAACAPHETSDDADCLDVLEDW